MAGADKKRHTRYRIEEISQGAHQAFYYDYLDDETINREINQYSDPNGRRFDDDLLPALLELTQSQELKDLLEFAQKTINRLPENVRAAVELALKEAKEDDG